MVIFWAAMTVLFIVIEAATIGLASIWFALGSLCALIAALLGAKLWLQILWFVLISVITLAATRPLVKKYVNARMQPTNCDRLIGATARVVEDINNIHETGAVAADGKTWTARSTDMHVTISEGERVVIKEIRGVKLIVEKKDE